jgi:hypothetical protein
MFICMHALQEKECCLLVLATVLNFSNLYTVIHTYSHVQIARICEHFKARATRHRRLSWALRGNLNVSFFVQHIVFCVLHVSGIWVASAASKYSRHLVLHFVSAGCNCDLALRVCKRASAHKCVQPVSSSQLAAC